MLRSLPQPQGILLGNSGVHDSLNGLLDVVVHSAQGEGIFLGVVDPVGGAGILIPRLAYGADIDRLLLAPVKERLGLPRDAPTDVSIRL